MTLDAVVVGAGVAGLRAATRLTRHGCSVRVLEARDRLGGRLFSFDHGGQSYDLGATWFWPHEQRITALIDELSIATFDQHLAGDALVQFPDRVVRADGNPLDAASGRFVQGAGAVTDAMAAELDSTAIRRGAAVTAVAAAPSGLTVSTEHESVEAAHVVIAVPPALAIAAIDFAPALPEPLVLLAADTPVWMGATTKAVVVYDRPFWRDENLAGAAMSHVGPLREIHDMSPADGQAGALFGFASSGPTAIDPAMIIGQLTTLFGDLAAHPIHIEIHDWAAQPFTAPENGRALSNYGTYGHRLYGEPAMEGRLHWASTETATDMPGHIEGALAAADRAAAAIIDGLQTSAPR